MKKILLIVLMMISGGVLYACTVCEKRQPKLFQGITHGTGPDSQWDYVIVSVTAAIVLFTLYFSIKWMIHPGEKSDNHIKRTVLKNE